MTGGDLFGDTVYESGDAVDDTDDFDPIESLSGDDPDEAMQTGYSPPEFEPYNLRHVPTAFEDRHGESLDQRLAEEEPELSEEDIFRAEREPRAGRLVAPDEGAHGDDEAEVIAADVGAAGYAASAEEAAMRIIDGT
jgi:hypothetical protein